MFLATHVATARLRKLISIPLACAAVLGLGSAANAQLNTFAGNAQHTNVYTATVQHLNQTAWTAAIDTTNSGSFAHYGESLITAANTVIVPVLTSGSSVTINAYDGNTGTFKYNLTTDYIMPSYDWIPEYQPVVVGTRLYFPGAGGTVYYVDNIDTNTPTAPTQICFYGLSTYQANTSTYNSTIFIDTPLTADSHGNIFFGFRAQGTPITPFHLNASNQPVSGWARISSAGVGNFVSVDSMTGDANMAMDSHNVAPALSNDESTLYVVAKQYNYSYNAYICGLDSTTLATKYNRHIADPRPGGSAAGPIDDSTATPLVGPDGDVYMGMFVTPYNGSRGYLAHYSSDLSVVKTPGAFGWDFTPGIVPSSMVPGYHGKSSYLLFCKYNNYDTSPYTPDGGDEINTVAVLDPEDETQIDWHPQAAGMTEMREVMTMIGPTANSEVVDPNSVREWCINATAVNPATDSVFFNSEDGRTYRWNLTQNSLAECLVLTSGFGAPYVPAFVGPDGKEYTLNGTNLYANGEVSGVQVTLDSDHPDARTTIVGDNVTFTANVTDPSATGSSTVTFVDEAFDNYTAVDTVLGTVPLVSGHASISTNSLKAGNYNSGADIYLGCHFITAKYNRDGTNPTASITRVQKVHWFASSITANSGGTSSISYGQPVTFNANIPTNPAGDVPKAMVAFVDSDGSVVAQAHTDGSGNVSVTTSSLSPGVHNITAVFNGDTEYATSSSSPVMVISVQGLLNFTASPLTVRGNGTSTGTLTIGANAGPSGEPVTVSSNSPYATIASSPVTVPSGTTQQTFTINTNNTTNTVQTAVITATDGVSKTQTLSIQPAVYASYVSQSCPTSMVAGQTYAVSVSFKNTGTTTWTAAAGYKLQSRSATNNTTWGANRMGLSNGPVTNGGTGVFKMNAIAPTTPGTYTFQWEPILDPISLSFGPSSPALSVTVAKAADAAFYVSDTAPTTVNAGADFSSTITFKNVGTNTWSSAAGYKLVSRNPYNNTTWGTNSVPLTTSVAPGASVTTTLNLTAPVTPGTYQWQWSMMHGGTLFGDLPPSRSVTVTLGSNDAQYVSQSVPVSVGPGTTFSGTITMENLGTATWDNTYALKSQNPVGNTTWGVSTIAVSGSVAQNSNAVFTQNFTAPSVPGTYNFQWRMFKGSAFGQSTPNVAIVVSADAAVYVSTQTLPTTVNAGTDFWVQYNMKNTGTTSWSGTTGYSMMSESPANNTTWNRNRMYLPGTGSFAPGTTVLITGLCTAPVTPGTYTMQWQMDKNGAAFGQATPKVSIVVTQGANDASFVSQSGVPASVPHGTTFSATITMQNLGTATWDNTYQLQSQNPNANTNWGTAGIASGTVAPNQSYSFVHTFTAPATPGTYHFQWRMYKSGSGMFGSYTTDVAITVT